MILIYLSILFNTPASAGWELLSSVDITIGYDRFMDAEVEKPVFSPQLLSAEGQEITLEGFMIPLDISSNQDYFVLSRFPYQSCFFCGGAGPETVVEIYVDQPVPQTDERISVRGTLRLNRDNPIQLFYLLKDCKVTVPN